MIRNVILAIILLAQVAVLLVLDPPWKADAPRSEPVKAKKLADIPLDQVEFVEMTEVSGKTTTLAKRNGAWLVENLQGFPAIADKVKNTLAELADLSKADFRSDKVIMHENYDVDAKKAAKVRLFGPNRTPIADLLIGKPDPQSIKGIFQDTYSTFIRRADQPDVYVTRPGRLGTSFPGDPNEWVRRTMMDVDMTADQARFLELKNSCFRIEVEGKAPVKGADGRPLVPPQTKNVRYVYARDPNPPQDGTDPVWRVVEPEGRETLELADLQLKGLVQQLLSTQIQMSQIIVGQGTKPEYKLDDGQELELRVVARFKEGDVTTTRTLEVGAEFEPPPLNGQPVAKQRYARVSHPGDPLQQSFIFSVMTTMPMAYLREPESMVRRDVPKPPPPQSQPVPPTTQPAPPK